MSLINFTRYQIYTYIALILLGMCAVKNAYAQHDIIELRLGHEFLTDPIHMYGIKELVKWLTEENVAQLINVKRETVSKQHKSLVENIQSGVLDIAIVPYQDLMSLAPRFGIFDIPFVFRSEEHVSTAQYYGPGDTMLKDLSAHGVHGLGWWPGEFKMLVGRKPIVSPVDLEGMQIASITQAVLDSPTESTAHLFARKIGAEEVRIPDVKLSISYAHGEVDVVEGTLREIDKLGLSSASVTKSNHLYAGYVVIVSDSAWKKLSERDRKIARSVVSTVRYGLKKKLHIAEKAAEERLTYETGTYIFPLPFDDFWAWRQATASETRAAKVGDRFIELVEYEPRFAAEQVLSGDYRDASPLEDKEWEIYWNTWLENSQGDNEDFMKVNGVYRVSLDISRLPYSLESSAAADGGVLSQLKKKNNLRLLLHPILLGSSLSHAPGKALEPELLDIKLERLKPGPIDKQVIDDFDSGKIDLHTLAKALSLGNAVTWEVKARQSGCGQMAFSVWDEARTEPIDHIYVSFPIHEAGKPAPTCGSDEPGKVISAGLDKLLYASEETAAGKQADAALHVFEVSESQKLISIAVLVNRHQLVASSVNKDPADRGIYGWEMASVLSDYISDPNQLPGLIKSAHDRLGTSKYPYESVASDMADVIFGGKSDTDREIANNARRSFVDIMSKVTEPIVVVRLVSASGHPVYLPIGLLAAQAKNPVIPKRFTVVQPLDRRRGSIDACIDSWKVARPTSLQAVGGDARDLLTAAASKKTPEGVTLLSTHEKLLKYFKPLQGHPSATKGEGLLLLAHHHKGKIYFNDSDRPPAYIRREHIYRKYPPGSLAILAACATSGASTETAGIVEQLQANGIEAMIVSPFEVDAEFGVQLALGFESLLSSKDAKNKTVFELFEKVTSEVADKYKKKAAIRDMALEMQIVGNRDLRVCK